MEIALNKPYLLSWLAIPVLILIGFLFRQHTLNVQFYATYYVVANTYFILVASTLLMLMGLGYLLVISKGGTLNPILTVFHLSLTVGVFILLVLPYFKQNSLLSPTWIVGSLLVFSLAQCAYVANILTTLLWR